MNQLPLFYHPTTLYWVDDDGLFLNIVTDRFKDDYLLKTSLSPNETIKYFLNYKSYTNSLTFLNACEEHDKYDSVDHLPVDLDFKTIRDIQANKTKQDDIAVMIVDYHMPEMSGIELCNNLSTITAKKILLTGNADFQEAVKAFNHGVINYFICKDDPNIDRTLTETVNKLHREYFINRTEPLLHHIESDYKLPQTDAIFINFFNQLCYEHNIKEYYLSDKNGGLLLISATGKTLYLVIHTDRTLDNFVDLHRNVNETKFFLKSVVSRSKIPFFGIGNEMWGLDSLLWPSYFYSPQILQGREKYYWTIIQIT